MGTAQLGLDYGIANRSGHLSDEAANALLHDAYEQGIRSFDTAQAYGLSEVRIGRFINELTKNNLELPNLITKLFIDEATLSSNEEQVLAAKIKELVLRSIDRLQVDALEFLLAHRIDYVTLKSGLIWETLSLLVEEGVIKNLGVSINQPEDLEVIDKVDNIQLIQFPFNILDWRWSALVELKRLKPSLLLHARSIYLQGLLHEDNFNLWPKIPEGLILQDQLVKLKQQLKYETLAELCFAYVKSLDWISGIVVGIESTQQIADNLRMLNLGRMTEKQIELIVNTFNTVPENFLMPSKWKTL